MEPRASFEGDVAFCHRQNNDPSGGFISSGRILFADKFHLDIKRLGIPLVIIYVGADFGSSSVLVVRCVHKAWMAGEQSPKVYSFVVRAIHHAVAFATVMTTNGSPLH